MKKPKIHTVQSVGNTTCPLSLERTESLQPAVTEPCPPRWRCASGCMHSWWHRWTSGTCVHTFGRSCRWTQPSIDHNSTKGSVSPGGKGDQRRTCRSRGYSNCSDWPVTWRWWRPSLRTQIHENTFRHLCRLTCSMIPVQWKVSHNVHLKVQWKTI